MVIDFALWRRHTKPVAASARTIPRWERAAPPVPASYLSLYQYLEHRYASMVVLTFDDIEALLGFPLPASARTEEDWWLAAPIPAHASAAWTAAGRTAVPNLRARTVAFERRLDARA
jgi:hypothetical protein